MEPRLRTGPRLRRTGSDAVRPPLAHHSPGRLRVHEQSEWERTPCAIHGWRIGPHAKRGGPQGEGTGRLHVREPPRVGGRRAPDTWSVRVSLRAIAARRFESREATGAGNPDGVPTDKWSGRGRCSDRAPRSPPAALAAPGLRLRRTAPGRSASLRWPYRHAIAARRFESETRPPAGNPDGVPTDKWSGRQDSNLRPSAPKADALPGCATPRWVHDTGRRLKSGEPGGGRPALCRSLVL